MAPTLADDIFQEARLAAWLAVKRYYPGETKLTSLVWTQVTWACCNCVGESRYRHWKNKDRRKLRMDRACDNLHMLMHPEPPPSDPDIPQVWAALTDHQALLLHYHVICDLSYGDIAAITGRTRSAVAQTVSSAKRKARKIMEGIYGTGRGSKGV